MVIYQLVKPIILALSNETAIKIFSRKNSKCQQISQQNHIDQMTQSIYIQPHGAEIGVLSILLRTLKYASMETDYFTKMFPTKSNQKKTILTKMKRIKKLLKRSVFSVKLVHFIKSSYYLYIL